MLSKRSERATALVAAMLWVAVGSWVSSNVWTELAANAGRAGVPGTFTVQECHSFAIPLEGGDGEDYSCIGAFASPAATAAALPPAPLVNPHHLYPKGTQVATRLANGKVYEQGLESFEHTLFKALVVLFAICAAPVACAYGISELGSTFQRRLTRVLWVAGLLGVVGIALSEHIFRVLAP